MQDSPPYIVQVCRKNFKAVIVSHVSSTKVTKKRLGEAITLTHAVIETEKGEAYETKHERT